MAFDSDVEFDPVSRQYSKSPLGELALTTSSKKRRSVRVVQHMIRDIKRRRLMTQST